jgi:hypothetical protein
MIVHSKLPPLVILSHEKVFDSSQFSVLQPYQVKFKIKSALEFTAIDVKRRREMRPSLIKSN